MKVLLLLQHIILKQLNFFNIMLDKLNNPILDFDDTAIAFERKTDAELRQMRFLFGMMNRAWLVSIGSRLTLLALKIRLPIQGLIKKTIFKQFCGGADLRECANSAAVLAKYKVKTVLDFGVEAKTTEADFDRTEQENLKAIQFAAKDGNVPIISVKVSGLARFDLLEKVSAKKSLTAAEEQLLAKAKKRLENICITAADNGVAIFVDAEESWIQDAIDELAMEMMQTYNRKKVVVYNTFQMYRHDRLAYLKASWEVAQAGQFILGAKIVRGAYMEKERDRAKEMGYPSPIQPDKAASDRDYNLAVEFCVANYQTVASCVASHNQKSSALQAALILEKGIDKQHAHLSFCQLYGMSDNLTFNLAKAGFNTSKYVPYGAVAEVMPYLIRRAKENSSVNGEVSRELGFIVSEIERRKNEKQ